MVTGSEDSGGVDWVLTTTKSRVRSRCLQPNAAGIREGESTGVPLQ